MAPSHYLYIINFIACPVVSAYEACIFSIMPYFYLLILYQYVVSNENSVPLGVTCVFINQFYVLLCCNQKKRVVYITINILQD